MRLHNERVNVEKGGLLVEQQFKLKATAKAFSILSSGLYSDKILAIVRELSCNAVDAHRAAGTQNVPFEIKLPTAFDATFHVKDFGTGLSHEDVLELYTTYFDSTKSESNDDIGALGLGSKSPFSYVSNFSVESRHNGMRRLYTAFIAESGVPSIAVLGEEKTTEPNGMTISLAAKAEDASKFLEATRRALTYFKHMPKVNGNSKFEPLTVTHTVHGTNWKMRASDWRLSMDGAYVVQGGVAYPIDANILAQNGLSAMGNQVLRQNIDVFVNIGDVEVAASREALSYTKQTIANLNRIVETAVKEMRTAIQKEFDDQPSLWAAQQMHVTYSSYRHKMHNLYTSLSNAKSFTYKGQELNGHVELDLNNVKSTALYVHYVARYRTKRIRSSGSWMPDSANKSYNMKVQPNMVVIVDDANRGRNAYFHMLKEVKSVDDNDTYGLVIKSINKRSYDAKEIDRIVRMLGGPTILYTSKSSYVKEKSTYTYRAKKSNEVMVWTGYPENGGYKRNQLRRVFSRLCWDGRKVDLKDGGFYVPVERFTIVEKFGDSEGYSYFDLLVEAMQKVKMIGTNPSAKTEIFGLTEKQVGAVKYSKGSGRWVNLFDFAKSELKKLNTNDELTTKMMVEYLAQKLNSGFVDCFIHGWPQLEKELKDGPFKSVVEDIAKQFAAAKQCKLATRDIFEAVDRIDRSLRTKAQKQADATFAVLTKTLEKYSMLQFVDWNKVKYGERDVIIEYINKLEVK